MATILEEHKNHLKSTKLVLQRSDIAWYGIKKILFIAVFPVFIKAEILSMERKIFFLIGSYYFFLNADNFCFFVIIDDLQIAVMMI